MSYSRVNKYKDLREGLKEEAGISRLDETDNTNTINNDEDDDFLSFLKPSSEKEKSIEDTLTEAKTFEQLRQESSKEIDKALKSVKTSVGKEDQYNTRMDILNKIRDPQANKIKIDAVDQYKTEQFSKGMFINSDKEEVLEEEKKPLPKMTLMERLQMMSPKEDAQKAQEVLEQEIVQEPVNEIEETIDEPTVNLEQTNSLEDMLSSIKEKDNRAVAEALKQDGITKYDFSTESYEDEEENRHEDKMAKVLNYVIVVLIIILIGLFGMIIYQSFF